MATPKHYIYAENGSTLIYTINNVIKRDPPISLDVPKEIAISNLRSQGEITVNGGISAYDITLEILLTGNNYTNVMSALNSLKTTVLTKTNYYLKYDKTLINNESLESIKVRLISIVPDMSRGNLTRLVYATLVFRALSW